MNTVEHFEIYPDKLNGEDIDQPESSFRMQFIYLHGYLEDKSGFDCCNINTVISEKGIYPVSVIWPNEYENATLYCKPHVLRGELAGLIIQNSDITGHIFAQEWYIK